MRSNDVRFALLAATAMSLLATSPARAQGVAPDILFVSGTGEANAGDPVEETEVLAQDNMASDDVEQDDSSLGNAEDKLNDLSAKMADPRVQDNLAGAVERMTEAMLDMPVGKIAAAVENSVPGANKGRKRIRESDTLADVAGRDADRLPEQLASGSRQMMGMMSGLAAAFATMMPEFEKMGEVLEESMADFENALPKR